MAKPKTRRSPVRPPSPPPLERLTDAEATSLRDLIRERGVAAVARDAHVNRDALIGALVMVGGSRRGTIALIRIFLAAHNSTLRSVG